MIVYLAEKSYLMFMLIYCIILPALSLSAVSYDWTFHESGTVPSGYYIQLYIILFAMELGDSVIVADGLFLCTIFASIIVIYLRYEKNTTYKSMLEAVAGTTRQCVLYARCTVYICFVIVFAASMIQLFEFAESGFFSINGYSKFCSIFSFIGKVLFGANLLAVSVKKEKYNKISNILTN